MLDTRRTRAGLVGVLTRFSLLALLAVVLGSIKVEAKPFAYLSNYFAGTV
jgi:hypothetical protein